MHLPPNLHVISTDGSRFRKDDWDTKKLHAFTHIGIKDRRESRCRFLNLLMASNKAAND
jgi:hypothetical protein